MFKDFSGFFKKRIQKRIHKSARIQKRIQNTYEISNIVSDSVRNKRTKSTKSFQNQTYPKNTVSEIQIHHCGRYFRTTFFGDFRNNESAAFTPVFEHDFGVNFGFFFNVSAIGGVHVRGAHRSFDGRQPLKCSLGPKSRNRHGQPKTEFKFFEIISSH